MNAYNYCFYLALGLMKVTYHKRSTFILYLFIYGLFNNIVTIWDCIVSIYKFDRLWKEW
jgi:hypothetical protein